MMVSPSPKRLSLLRASEFCQTRRPSSCQVQVLLVSCAPKKRKRRWHADSTIWCEPDLLVSLSMRQGDVAWFKPCDDSAESVPVIMRIVSEGMMETQSKFPTIYVPPTLAASVGCTWNNERALLVSNRSEIQKASSVLVSPVGRPIPRTSLLCSPNSQRDLDPVSLLQRGKRLLTASSLISVLVQGDLFFFEVVQIEGLDSTSLKKRDRDVFVTGAGTRWRLEPSDSSGLVRRLPCLSVTRRYHQSLLLDESKQHGNSFRAQEQHGEHHPSLDEMVRALSIPTNVPTAAQKIVHVVGSEENHVGTCIETAADQLGMRCLHVHGLAAFAHSQGEIVSSGSLMDQITGLQKAISQAQDCSPCVVHLQGFEHELNQADEPMRQMQEQRFWTVLTESISSKGTAVTDDKQYWAHPVLVVISTGQALSAGPLLQNLVYAPIKLQPPSEAYALKLWGADIYEEASPHLMGLSAQEVLHLKRLWTMKCTSGCTTTDRVATLESCRQELETQRKKVSVQIPNVQWDDVGGLAHVRSEIVDAIELPLRHAHLFPHSGRSGILLYGPPGTGKTLVAKAVATECGLPFLSVKGPELLGSYVGESEANVRAAFASAREAAHAVSSSRRSGAAILFFDELDSLAPRRGGVGDGGGVMERVVATLLTELDGRQHADANGNKKDTVVFVVGATNRPDLLDPSLLRPGRFDRLVYLGQASTSEERAQILAALIRKFKLEQDQDPLAVAMQVVDQLPQSLSGADFSAIASSALMRSLRRLCEEAEVEVAQLKEQSSVDSHDGAGDLDQVLNQWDDERLVPVVTPDDFIEAGKNVIPSVSAQELANFERLRVQFSTS